MKSVSRNQDGAAVIFGLFFAVFLVGVVYALLGVSESLMFRQRMQDASDAAAFSAAVVNARGMNLIALINMAMAAALSVLVGLRLAQTLIGVAIGILAGMSVLTGGSSLLAIGTLTETLISVTNAANRVEKAMPRVLNVLHTAGKVVSVVVPVGANARVMDTVAKEHPPASFGVALPSRFTLPIEDDAFPVLCGHAGEFAADVALLPFAGVLKGKAREAIDDAASAITSAGSGWFCGQGGEPPDLSAEGATYKHRPVLPKREECDRLTEVALKHDKESDDTDLAGRPKKACALASVEELASTPNRQGLCHEGQPVCPTTCDSKNPDARCPPDHFEPCSREESAELALTSLELYGKETVSCGSLDAQGRPAPFSRSAYAQRLRDARRQCDPTQHPDYTGYAWNERTVVYVYTWSDVTGWTRSDKPESYGPIELVVRERDDDRKPCIDTPKHASVYERDERIIACQGAAVCLEPALAPFGGFGGACLQPKDPRAEGKPTTYREQVTQITDIISCVEELETPPAKAEPLDLGKRLESAKKDKSKNTSSFRVEKGVWLGGSDFQLRSVVSAARVPDIATNMIKLASWGREESSGTARVANTASRELARFSLAQAEYYFDTRELGDDAEKTQLASDARSEWLWHMSWRARLRPFRINHAKADGPRDEKEAGPDREQLDYLPSKYTGEIEGLDCSDVEGCGDAQQILDVFGDGEEE